MMSQKEVKNRLVIAVPIICCHLLTLIWSKLHSDSFSNIWRYFTFFNQLIAIPMLACASIYLKQNKRNYFITLIPMLFYVFITMAFIFNQKIGFNLPLLLSEKIAIILTLLAFIYIVRKK